MNVILRLSGLVFAASAVMLGVTLGNTWGYFVASGGIMLTALAFMVGNAVGQYTGEAASWSQEVRDDIERRSSAPSS